MSLVVWEGPTTTGQVSKMMYIYLDSNTIEYEKIQNMILFCCERF